MPKAHRAHKHSRPSEPVTPEMVSLDAPVESEDGDKAGWNYVSFRNDNIRVGHKCRDGQIRFKVAVTPHLREDVDEALNVDKLKGKVVKGETRIVFSNAPWIFSRIGIPDGKIYTKAFIIRKTAKDHHLTPEQIASAPNLLASPAAVFVDSDEKHQGYVFITDAIAPDQNGVDAPVMIYIRPDGEGNYIASEYAKTEAGEAHYVNLVNAGKVLYLDKNKIARLPLRGEAKSSLSTFSAGDNVVTPEGLTEDIIPQTGSESQGGKAKKDPESVDRVNATPRVFGGCIYPVNRQNKISRLKNKISSLEITKSQARNLGFSG